MTDQIILQLITTITTFCSTYNYVAKEKCIEEIWTCGHKVNNPIAIVSETHNCITRYMK